MRRTLLDELEAGQDAQMTVKLRKESTSSDRLSTYTYLSRLLPHGGMFELRTAAHEQAQIGNASALFSVSDESGALGAAYVGPSWEEAEDMARRGAFALADSIARRVYSLHGIGVEESRRGTGIGSRLLAAAEKHARASGAQLVIGVAQGADDLSRFYTKNGYSVGDHAHPLILKAGGEGALFEQQDEHSQWFSKALQTAEHPLVEAIHPSDAWLREMGIVGG